MKVIISILLIICFGFKAIANNPLPVTVSITDFGAVGDGTTDCYYPFKMAAAFAAANPNTTINFPSGTFYIAKYRTVKNDTIDHIKWNNCVGLKLIGVAGSTIISVNGTFFRPISYVTASCARKSYTTGLSPFYFINCTDLEISGMEVTGNVQNTTRAAGVDVNNPSVTESSNILLRFTKCTDVVVDEMYLHHAESDGIMISGDRVAGVWVNSRNFTVTDVRSFNNGRQGMSVGGLTNGYFLRCNFNYSGFTGGTYGHNDPAAGVDLEPGANHYLDSIKFESCTFNENYGNHFICSYPETTSNITLLKDTIIVTGEEKPQGLTLLARYSLIDSCFFSFQNRDMKITNVDHPGSTIAIKNSTIESTGNFILTTSTSVADSIVIQNNQFNYVSNVMTSAFITLQATNLWFLDNDIFIPIAALDSKPTGFHCFVENAIISQGNLFHSETATKPRVSYTGTLTVDDL